MRNKKTTNPMIKKLCPVSLEVSPAIEFAVYSSLLVFFTFSRALNISMVI